MEKGIRTEQLHIGYDKDLVRDITLQVSPGKIVTLIGPNGCGKSTLLKTLTGELRKRGGTVFLDGDDLSVQKADEIAKKMSVVMTYRVKSELLTCKEVVELGRYPYTGRLGILSDKDRGIVRESMDWAEVTDLGSAYFRNISDGQKQRVMLARAVCQEPEVLILDEPTSYLDIRHKLDILEKVASLAKEKNMAVLMSLHELEIAMRISDHVVALGEGRILRTGTPREVFREDFIRSLYRIEGMDTEVLGGKYWFEEKDQREDRPALGKKAGMTAGKKSSHPKVLMIQGTMSNAGKSLIAAGLCRILKQDGYRVAPFKSQNMALNSYVTKEGLEMGRAQVMQAECAGIEPAVCMNPILLKPTDDRGSQLIINGEPIGNMSASAYFRHKADYRGIILGAYEKLSGMADVIIVEGAGSPVELNLKKDDIVNMGLAEMIDAPVLLVGDIDRGGIFPQLLGTLDLFEKKERDRVKGLLVNKFRGDPGLFEDGIRILEERGRTKVAGVIPYLPLRFDDEDSLSERFDQAAVGAFDIAVIRLPHISNFTDFNTFDQIDGVSLRYVSAPEKLGDPDMILLPGSKNTLGDLRWMKETGISRRIKEEARKNKVIFGICGGYQMLGRSVSDPEHTEGGGEEEGLALLPVDTVLGSEKIRKLYSGSISGAEGILKDLKGLPLEGYEIHMGRTFPYEEVTEFTSGSTGYCKDNIYGCYIHGFFDKSRVTETLLGAVAKDRNKEIRTEGLLDYASFRESRYDLLAVHLRQCLDMDYIRRIMGLTDDC